MSRRRFIAHTDMSGKFHRNEDIGVAWCSVDQKHHKGLCLKAKFVKSLDDEFHVLLERPRLLAICLYAILKEDLKHIEELIICNDEPYGEVKDYLDILFETNSSYEEKRLTSLAFYRKRIPHEATERMRSFAHNKANAYRKRAGKSPHRRQRGAQLNTVSLGLDEIRRLWKKIDRFMNKNGE